jgi:hypothetical protein
MNVKTLIISILTVLVVSNVSPAQVSEAPEQKPQERVIQESDSSPLAQQESISVSQAATAPTQPTRTKRRIFSTTQTKSPSVQQRLAPESQKQLRIFELKYADTEELARLIGNIFQIDVNIDYRLNRLIVNATDEQMESVESLIEATDVPGIEASSSQNVQNLVYRIYMFETSSGDEDMKPFSMILQAPPEASTMLLLDAAPTNRLQISGFCLSDERDRDGKAEILIQGKAYSHESLKRIVYDAIPDSRIKELKWDDAETFTNEIEAAQFRQLSEQLQKHIQKLLGDDIRTVGYWFGNSSVPGEVQAPIGPWTLNMKLNPESDQMLEIGVEVELPREIHNFDTRLGHQQKDEILSNMIRAKIGKPIIIGYNRESYGSRKMGAMVIVPEMDTIQVKEK